MLYTLVTTQAFLSPVSQSLMYSKLTLDSPTYLRRCEHLGDLNFEKDPAYKGMSHGERAQELKNKAKELMKEAKAMEMELLQAKKGRRKPPVTTTDLVDRLFLNKPLTAESVARTMREERWASELAISATETLYWRLKKANEEIQSLKSNQTDVSSVSDVSLATAGRNITETAYILENYMSCFLEATELMDAEALDKSSDLASKRWTEGTNSKVKSRLRELRTEEDRRIQKHVAARVQHLMSNNTGGIRRSLGMLAAGSMTASSIENNNTASFNSSNVNLIPRWVPSNFVQLLAQSTSLLDRKDVDTIETVLSSTSFFRTSSDCFDKAAIFKGNLRSQGNLTTSEVFEDIQRRMEVDGVSKRVQLFLLPDYESLRKGSDFQDTTSLPPAILAVPAEVEPKRDSKGILTRAIAAFVTCATLYGYSVGCFALNPLFFRRITEYHDGTAVSQCLPLCFLLLSIQTVYEMVRLVVAKRKKIQLSRPILVPSPHLGTLGCITKLETFPRNRRDLFDVAIAGPLAAMSMSIVMIVLGIRFSIRSSQAGLVSLPMVPNTLLQSSSVVGGLLARLAPKVLLMPTAQPIPMHSLVLAGYSGLVASALNVLPLFRLDGGRICGAVRGNRSGAFISVASVLFVASFGLQSGLVNFWLLYVLLWQRSPSLPCRDELSSIGTTRTYIWYAVILVAVATLLPYPGGGTALL